MAYSIPHDNRQRTYFMTDPLLCGTNKHLFKRIKKVNESFFSREKVCLLKFDKIPLTKHLSYNVRLGHIDGYVDLGKELGRRKDLATHALVFIVTGLTDFVFPSLFDIKRSWKQLVGYYFISDDMEADILSAIIKEMIVQCSKAGFIIAGTVCDLDKINMEAFNQMGATIENPFFNINGREIAAIIDPPNLLAGLWEVFVKHDMEFHQEESQPKLGIINGVAKFQHVRAFYERAMDNNIDCRYYLIDKHVELNDEDTVAEKFVKAENIFSYEVAGGIETKCRSDIPESIETTMFVSKIGRLFETLNANSKGWRKGSKYWCNITPKRTYIEKYWEEWQTLFKEVKVFGSESRPLTLDGWVWTLGAVQRLWRNLKIMNIDILSTKLLRLDVPRKLFDWIGRNCESKTAPTCRQFLVLINTALMINLNTKKDRTGDDEEEFDDSDDGSDYYESSDCDCGECDHCEDYNRDCDCGQCDACKECCTDEEWEDIEDDDDSENNAKSSEDASDHGSNAKNLKEQSTDKHKEGGDLENSANCAKQDKESNGAQKQKDASDHEKKANSPQDKSAIKPKEGSNLDNSANCANKGKESNGAQKQKDASDHEKKANSPQDKSAIKPKESSNLDNSANCANKGKESNGAQKQKDASDHEKKANSPQDKSAIKPKEGSNLDNSANCANKGKESNGAQKQKDASDHEKKANDLQDKSAIKPKENSDHKNNDVNCANKGKDGGDYENNTKNHKDLKNNANSHADNGSNKRTDGSDHKNIVKSPKDSDDHKNKTNGSNRRKLTANEHKKKIRK